MITRRKLRRLGCLLLLIPWFFFILSPCFVIILATQGEIILSHSDLPNHHFRIWLLQEISARGVGITTSRRIEVSSPEPLACTIMDVRFLLWGGDAQKSGALPSHQCACYARLGDQWDLRLSGAEACRLAGETP